MLYADDLVLTAETLEGMVLMFGEWRTEGKLEDKKMIMTGLKVEDIIQVGRGIHVQRVLMVLGAWANSVLCGTCGNWCHTMCSGLKSLIAAVVSRIQCLACTRRGAGAAVGISGGVVREVKQFCYLGDVFD